jgi:uncharacterized protein YjbI with pentapeptide repeats
MRKAAERTGLTRPHIPARRLLRETSAEGIVDGGHFDGLLVRQAVIADDRLEHARFDHSVLEGVALPGANAEGIMLRHVELMQCDWSNAHVESASWVACAVEGSKLTGTRLNRCVFKDVTITDCRADFVQFQEARFERVVFDNCSLGQSFFTGAQMAGTIFDGCDLTGADFSHALITGSDLRRSRIEDIRIAPEQLRGVIVTQDQAIYLAGLLGLDIREA